VAPKPPNNPPPSANSTWKAKLSSDGKGVVIPSAYNAAVILAHDPVFHRIFARNAFTARNIVVTAPPSAISSTAPQPGPYPRAWAENDIFIVQAYLNKNYNHKFGFETVERAMAATAASTSFHPVLDWIETLAWDNTPRIDTWLTTVFGAPDTPYTRAIGAMFLIAAVRRVRSPGCQFDQMLVLEGAQNLGKSRSCRTLFGTEWFTDDLPHDLRNKDSPLALLGVWGIELSEIDHLLRNDVEVVKAFLSRRIDRFRPPYGRGMIEQPRQSVMLGTTNSDDYLRDATGNRRFWPVRCAKADYTWIAEHRDQLWAEAAAREATGESIFLATGHQATETAQAEQENRLDEDPWTEPVRDFLADLDKSYAHEILADALKVPTERQDKRAQIRLAKILKLLGWSRRMSRDEGGFVTRFWQKSNNSTGHELSAPPPKRMKKRDSDYQELDIGQFGPRNHTDMQPPVTDYEF
jgi:predicted P-loop ATPase